MAAQLRAKIYGAPLANFSLGYPSKCEAMQHYIWCLEEQYKVNNRLNDTTKKAVRDQFVANLRTHWSNQPTPKPTMDAVEVNKKVKPLIDFYFGLKDEKKKLEDQPWIDSQKEKLRPILDIEKKPVVTKKRSIQEVRNYQDSKVCQIVDVKQKFVLSSKIIS